MMFDICARRHKGNPESAAAHASIINRKKAMSSAILEVCRRRPSTCDEVEVELGILHQTAGARIAELKAIGLLIDTKDRRPTRSGRMAAVLKGI